MRRAELQRIAVEKLDDAELLFRHGRYSNAYYLFGYAVEIALKARLARFFEADTIPDRKFVNDLHTHNLARLMEFSGLQAELRAAQAQSVRLNAHWSTVTDWSEASRYDMIDQSRATAMRDAVASEEDGVFEWLRKRW
ncbi:HEPN domain-containing protein [Ciceribacter sp. L1K23]|uniref:HEPN domain-containing protein n=1 Tax=unclassified Ciceribacter TaxID=2628820 RepID=UPI001ABEA00C|nr:MULTISPECIES: HEPN domain-containing protein [unclassified Ciceribacter]MBO3760788.1 HEPN domain-containing protein [Ciceribacter sp. L1K22]MBR0555156.1 HEPN domain-containing protein [Ciceribacter sp. L1K23]